MKETPEMWAKGNSAKARQMWAEYQHRHDLSDRSGQTAGIDPRSGRIWFGESFRDIIAQRDAEGLTSPLFFERVGSKAYYRKGSGRGEWGAQLQGVAVRV